MRDYDKDGNLIAINQVCKTKDNERISIQVTELGYVIKLLPSVILKTEKFNERINIEEAYSITVEYVKSIYDRIEPLSDKEDLLDTINRSYPLDITDPYFMIKETFPKEEIEKMDYKEINNLIRLANNTIGILY